MKLTILRIFTLWKLANTTKQSFYFFEYLFYQSTTRHNMYFLVYTLTVFTTSVVRGYLCYLPMLT
jgi:hypothetical protein